ncbi:hypothetical protein ACS0TY_004599 [Phlomoides rotata]
MGKSLVHDLVHRESEEIADKLLFHALRGEEDKNVELRVRTYGTETNEKAVFLVVNACCSKENTNNIVGVCFVGQDVTGQKVMMDKFIHIQGDYKAIIHNPNPLIPPIFTSDENTIYSEWNAAMEKLTGWSRGDMIGKMLVGEIFGSCCRLKGSKIGQTRKFSSYSDFGSLVASTDEEATWEEYLGFQRKYPHLLLEDKQEVERGNCHDQRR